MLSFSCGLKNCVQVRTQVINYQSVRWQRTRKPFWLGLAKSKMFVVPKKKQLPRNEFLEKLSIERQYNTHMKSLTKFIVEENTFYEEQLIKDFKGPTAESELKKDIENSIKQNDIWNSESAKLREERLLADSIKREKIANLRITKEKQKEAALLEKIDLIVKAEKEKSKEFVTPDNLDQAIDHCLNNPIEYNFAIDVKGKKYPGKDTFRLKKKVETTEEDDFKEKCSVN